MYSFLMRVILFSFLFISTLFADNHILEQENFEAWQFTCVSEQNQKICDLRELVFDSNTNEVVSYLSITINPENLTQMQIAFPHAVNLKSPVKLQIDDNDPLDLNYAYCNQSACFVAEIIGENFVNFFKAGNQISLKVLFLDNREATITYSLSGFTAGYSKLSSSRVN
jgi:invasion protein IalB